MKIFPNDPEGYLAIDLEKGMLVIPCSLRGLKAIGKLTQSDTPFLAVAVPNYLFDVHKEVVVEALESLHKDFSSKNIVFEICVGHITEDLSSLPVRAEKGAIDYREEGWSGYNIRGNLFDGLYVLNEEDEFALSASETDTSLSGVHFSKKDALDSAVHTYYRVYVTTGKGAITRILSRNGEIHYTVCVET